ncbi:MAG: tetratricopeptide repeat protein, partial [Bacteroidales bacterium]|nr:tetratricopeptide repeat protein [Bacteroidales bacterium]
AHVWHNIGNSLLESQQFAQSIEAYKNSLRLNPGDQDTKYNLAYAKKKLQEQEQQQQEQQNQEQDQEKQEQDQDQQQQEQQPPRPQEISKEDAERMLNAIQQQEKDVKEKVDKKKAAVAKVKTDKDW